MPVFARTRPAAAVRTIRRESVPLRAATGNDEKKPSLKSRARPRGPEQLHERGRGQPVQAREPGAVGDPDSVQRHPVLGQDVADDERSGSRRPTAGLERSEMLEQDLGREVVALVVHVAQDAREGRREQGRDRKRLRVDARRAGAGGPDDAHAGLGESLAEQKGGRVSRCARDASEVAPPVDGQRRERGRLVDEEVRLPARTDPERVEVRLVSDDPARDEADACTTDLRGEPPQPERRQRRIAEALQHEVAVPLGPVLLPDAEHLCLDSVGGSERHEGRIRDGELLVRRRDERQGRIARVDHASRRQLDRDRRRTRDARRVQRTCELGRERVRASRRGLRVAGKRKRAGEDDRSQAEAGRHVRDSSDQPRMGLCDRKIGRAAHRQRARKLR